MKCVSSWDYQNMCIENALLMFRSVAVNLLSQGMPKPHIVVSNLFTQKVRSFSIKAKAFGIVLINYACQTWLKSFQFSWRVLSKRWCHCQPSIWKYKLMWRIVRKLVHCHHDNKVLLWYRELPAVSYPLTIFSGISWLNFEAMKVFSLSTCNTAKQQLFSCIFLLTFYHTFQNLHTTSCNVSCM